MTAESDEADDASSTPSRRKREWAIFVVGGFIGSSITYYLGEPVVWALGILILMAPFIVGDQWWPQLRKGGHTSGT